MNFRKIILLIFGALSSLLSVESFKAFLNDEGGGLVLPSSAKAVNDEDWLEYRNLNVDETVKSINPKDLPDDFCDEACRLVDEFHKKTVNEEVEWLLYFDYKTGEVIYCWKGENRKITGDFDKNNLMDKSIASIHCHTNNLYSFPSPDNFDILENGFEDFEIITSVNAFWLVEFKGSIDGKSRRNFQRDLGADMSESMMSIRLTCESI